MSKAAKQIIFILGFLLLGSVVLAVLTLNEKKSLEQDNVSLNQQLTDTQSREKDLIVKRKKAEEEVKRMKVAKSKLEEQLAATKTQMDIFNAQISEISAENQKSKSMIDDLRRERDELMAKLKEGGQPQIIYKEVPVDKGASAKPSVSPDQVDDAFWAQVLKEKAALQVQLADLEDKSAAESLTIQELQKKNSDLKLELDAVKSNEEDQVNSLHYNENLANNLSIELARTKNDNKFVRDRNERLKAEIAELRGEVKRLTTSKVALERSVARLTEDKNKIQKQLIETESVIQGKIDEIWDIKENLQKRLKNSVSQSTGEVELPPIIVSAPGPAVRIEPPNAPRAGFGGNVISVNSDNNFVIVDIGQGQGIQVGDSLNVYRDSKYIAGIEIIQIRQDISAADIKDQVAKIQVGDTVK